MGSREEKTAGNFAVIKGWLVDLDNRDFRDNDVMACLSVEDGGFMVEPVLHQTGGMWTEKFMASTVRRKPFGPGATTSHLVVVLGKPVAPAEAGDVLRRLDVTPVRGKVA